MSDFNGPKWEALDLFHEYMEDYNTATLPHKKYYDIEQYEMKQYQKQQLKQSHSQHHRAHLKTEEDALQRQRQAEREQQDRKDFQLVLQTMDKDKIEAMRHQEQVRAEMQLQYKAGNVAEARRLEQVLRSEDK